MPAGRRRHKNRKNLAAGVLLHDTRTVQPGKMSDRRTGRSNPRISWLANSSSGMPFNFPRSEASNSLSGRSAIGARSSGRWGARGKPNHKASKIVMLESATQQTSHLEADQGSQTVAKDHPGDLPICQRASYGGDDRGHFGHQRLGKATAAAGILTGPYFDRRGQHSGPLSEDWRPTPSVGQADQPQVGFLIGLEADQPRRVSAH